LRHHAHRAHFRPQEAPQVAGVPADALSLKLDGRPLEPQTSRRPPAESDACVMTCSCFCHDVKAESNILSIYSGNLPVIFRAILDPFIRVVPEGFGAGL
jgi:hypothetical protein